MRWEIVGMENLRIREEDGKSFCLGLRERLEILEK
jgi:hypothetical protein